MQLRSNILRQDKTKVQYRDEREIKTFFKGPVSTNRTKLILFINFYFLFSIYTSKVIILL